MEADTLILIVNFATTLFMTGVIWFVQIVHYPLFGKVGEESFIPYEDAHQKLTTWVVGPTMLLEALTAMLLIWYPPPVDTSLLLLAAGLLLIIWTSTALLQAPGHSELSRGFDAKVHGQLVLGNWLRTVCWTLRAILVAWFVNRAIEIG